MSYVDVEYYKTEHKGLIPDEVLESYLTKASDNIDQLTYCRLKAKGLAGLTNFQQDYVKKAVCSQADFLYDTDKQGLPQGIQSYSINGTTVSFGNSSNYSSTAIAYLMYTNLMYGGIR